MSLKNEPLTNAPQFSRGAPLIRRTEICIALAFAVAAISPCKAFAIVGQTYNVPPGPAPSTLASGDILNVFPGGLVAGNANLNVGAGSAVNIQGGTITSEVDSFGEVNLYSGAINSILISRPGSTLNVHGGALGAGSINSSATWNLFGGQIFTPISVQGASVININGAEIGGGISMYGGTINLSKGSLGAGIGPVVDTQFNMTGGTLDHFQFGNGSVWDLSGGLTPGHYEVSVLHIRAASAFISGVPISAPLGQEMTITQRNVTLSGVLQDGSPNSLDLTSAFGGIRDFVPVEATVTVTLVPEPATAITNAVASICLFFNLSAHAVRNP